MGRGPTTVLAAALAAVLLTACVPEGGGGPPESANTSRGPIEIWLSTNPEEVAWGEEVVAAWNSEHPNEQITAHLAPMVDGALERLETAAQRLKQLGQITRFRTWESPAGPSLDLNASSAQQ